MLTKDIRAREFMGLIEDGFLQVDGSRRDRQVAREMSCDCGESMELRAFELIGDVGERVMYRTYAVCPACRPWVEF